MAKLSRIITLLGISGSLITLAGCDVKAAEYVPGTPVKVGLICLHDTQSTYDKNFIDAMNDAVKELGPEIVDGEAIIKTGVPEENDAFIAAKDLIKQGCNVIFADSFGHEPHILRAAKKYPTVTFCHATGTKAKTENVANYHNAFASIYEGRYLAGYAAGLKLQRMIEAGQVKASNKDANGNIKLGYVGAYPYAEVVSGYTSWYLGVKEVVNNVVMDVTFTSSWYNQVAEENSAKTLISRGAVLISQHADSMGAPGACEAASVGDTLIPNVSYNISTQSECPKTYVAYSKIDWAPYYKAVIQAKYEGKAIEGETNNNYTGTLGTGSVKYEVANQEDRAAVKAIEDELATQTRRVFDCSKFTVKGEHLTSYKADVDDYGDWVPETEAIKTVNNITFFDESAQRSAPYFDVEIDGITKLNA